MGADEDPFDAGFRLAKRRKLELEKIGSGKLRLEAVNVDRIKA